MKTIPIKKHTGPILMSNTSPGPNKPKTGISVATKPIAMKTIPGVTKFLSMLEASKPNFSGDFY